MAEPQAFSLTRIYLGGKGTTDAGVLKVIMEEKSREEMRRDGGR
jgi:hypothetical protein